MYATKQDMINTYGGKTLIELTDRDEPYTGAIVDAVLDLALEDANALIDSFISRRYDLPLASAPPVLRRQACAIAFYTLSRDRYSDETKKAFDDAMRYLRDVSDGKALLDVAGSQPKSAPAEARVDGPERIFSRDEMKGF